MSLASAAWTLAVGGIFGLALAAPPGPMNAVIAEESALRGWLAGFTAGLGAMTADLIFLGLSLAGVVAFLDEAATLRTAMVAVGGLLMLYFAAGAIRDARESFTADRPADPDSDAVDPIDRDPDRGDAANGRPASEDDFGSVPSAQSSAPPVDASDTRGFRKAFLLALTNPYQILFWLTVGVGLLRPGTVDVLAVMPLVGADLAGVLVVRTGSPALLVGLFCGIVVWIVGFPATLVRIGRRVDAFAPTVAALSAVVLAGFGLAFLWTAASSFL